MLTKTFAEMMAIDVLPYCDTREAKDEHGKKILVPYLNWAKCKQLLHEHGAEQVYYEPLYNDHGHSLFMSNVPFVNKNEQVNRCYEVRVRVVVDNREWVMNYPLLNGTLVVRDDTLNQLRVSNAQARAFVKCVAIHTGLGFSLWLKESDIDLAAPEDLSFHSLAAIQQRVQEKLTVKISRGMELDDILAHIGINQKQFQKMLGYYKTLYNFETELDRL